MTVKPDRLSRRTLTRHFFRGFFRFTFLDDAGEESVVRSMIGVLVAIVAAGIIMSRLYSSKYVFLSNSRTSELYQAMLPADQMAVIALPMLFVALVMALITRSLFPDELDFRVLMPLPLSRRLLFQSKAAALTLYAGIFILSANLVTAVPFGVISGGRWADEQVVARVTAQLAAGLLASLFVAMAIVAFQGIVMLVTPRRWLARALLASQTLMVCEAVLLIPAVLRLPRLWNSLPSEPAWLFLVAPAWFLGLQRWLLGDSSAYYARLASLAVVACGVIAIVIAACYLTLYRRFDRVWLDAGLRRRSSSEGSRDAMNFVPWGSGVRLLGRHPAHVAVRRFTAATLGRSGLHQLVVSAALAAGVALAVNNILMNLDGHERWRIHAAAGAPLMAMVVALLGMRSALLLPSNLRAAWIFRLTEREDDRPQQLNAVRQVLWSRGVLLPVLLVSVASAGVLGLTRTLAALPVLSVIGWILVEVLTLDWRRIPFTCTVLFGKRPAAQTAIFLFAIFFVFVVLGTPLVQTAISSPPVWAATATLLVAIALAVRHIRLQTWGQMPLEFEDYLPDSLQTLHL